ncbi:hypothetical protein CHGG_03628 [Chaetomium globosum CBS 148.51]|uniref:Mid2 domain-containing protein n=1 Tax=Chaetomium globosum (strain ATCC 6205 / CBS 148.51 / DSM 1962 / NBRC 6347 / NRRL 1970) TaxID=306901 RepID=Q2H826_CHAGB|nr:uncharacterized protein CHGG_03628 [Chaetomium globosum CBS 148.51]EAQ91693.1 hypothetical protein CHGG_03628 [Chaetomium globosum CBS 148.51]
MATSKGLGPLGLLCTAAVATFPSIFLATSLYPASVSAATDDSLLINCYRWDGAITANNTKCPNSNACCGPTATCLSNRLCKNVGDGPNLWVRGPCAIEGWDDDCAQICKYNETTGIFPRVTPCNDGSLCCNDDPQCCQNGNGIFLDESGNRASAKATAATTSYPPVSDGLERFTLTPSTSTTSTSSTSATTASADESSTTTNDEPGAATTSSSTTPPPDTSNNSDDSIGLKVGLGLGIPLAVILTAIAVYFFLRRRNRHANGTMPDSQQPYDPYGGDMAQPGGGYPYSAGTNYAATANPPGYPDQHPGVYAGQQKYQPVEIMGHSATELDGSQYGPRERHELS